MLLLSTEELRIKEQLQAVLAMISAIPTAVSVRGHGSLATGPAIVQWP